MILIYSVFLSVTNYRFAFLYIIIEMCIRDSLHVAGQETELFSGFYGRAAEDDFL